MLIPWGYDVAYPPDYNAMLNLAKNATAKFRRYKYSVGNSAALLYSAAGINHYYLLFQNYIVSQDIIFFPSCRWIG